MRSLRNRAESPKETWLRLLVIRNGFPPPTTQIPVYNQYGMLVAVLDMGWEEIKLALDYEGEHHRNPVRFNIDIRRHDEVTELGWMDIRVTSHDTEGGIIAPPQHRMESPNVKPPRKTRARFRSERTFGTGGRVGYGHRMTPAVHKLGCRP